MHLQYLVDATEKFLTEEHAIVEDYVLGMSFNHWFHLIEKDS